MLASLHHACAKLVQNNGMGWRELRSTRQQRVRLPGAAGSARGFGGLNDL
jgi:hypothetical protein